jgi:hypothetical protein
MPFFALLTFTALSPKSFLVFHPKILGATRVSERGSQICSGLPLSWIAVCATNLPLTSLKALQERGPGGEESLRRS